jgi:hypothetical protein
MTLEIETISSKKFTVISLLSVPIMIGICVGMSIIFDSGLYVLLIFPLLFGIFVISKKVSSQIVTIDIGSERVSVHNKTIHYNTIQGYHINKTGLIMSSLDLRLTNGEIFTISCSNFGEKGIRFTQLTEKLIKAIGERNQSLLPMNYQDVHVKQMKFLRPLIISAIVIVLLLDLLAVILVVIGEKSLPWQVLIVNVVILSLIPYLKRSKIK